MLNLHHYLNSTTDLVHLIECSKYVGNCSMELGGLVLK